MKTTIKIVIVLLLIALIISIIILACVPPVSKDALTHHLAVPKLYLNHGGIYEIPATIFSYYPMNLDLLYIIPLYFGNDIIPKYIHFGFALLTAGLIFHYLKYRLNSLYAFIGVLFFLSVPVIVKLSITVYVDLGLIFFSSASLIYLLKWIDHSFQLRFLIISAIWCGLALGSKYNGLISLLLFALIVPIIYIRSKSSKERCEKPNRTIAFKQSGVMIQCMAVGYGAVFIIIALMVFSPWMIRNTIWTNNPVYPFYDHFFKYKIFNISDLQEKEKNKEIELNIKKSGAPINHFTLRKIVFKEAWWQTALIPVRIFFSGKDGTPKYFDGKLNPFLCILPIFAFIGIKKKNRITKIEKYVFIAFSILYLFIVFFQIDMRIRWIAPIIPPLVILSMYGLYEINTLLTKQKFLVKGLYREIVIIFIIGVILLPNFSYIVEQFKYVDPFSYISGKLKRSEYIEKYRPEYPVIRYANENLPTDAKIFSIFLGMRSYYSDRELIFFNSGSFLQTLKNVKSPKAIQHELEKTGITHIIVGYDLLDSWANQSLGLQEKELLVKFFKKQAKLIFSNGKYGLYEFL